MPKDYTANKLENIVIRINIPAYDDNNNLYHAALVKIHGVAKNGAMKAHIERPETYLGAGQATEWTNKQIYTALNNYNNLNDFIADELKQLYIDAIDEDPSI